MTKKFVAFLLTLTLLISMMAAAQAAAVPSVTIGSLIGTTGVVTPEAKPEEEKEEAPSGLLIYLAPVEATVEEKVVLESITQHVETKPVAEYFAPETLAAVTELLPPETKTEDLKMDEFFVLKTEGYTEDHGDMQVAFEFYTPYTPEDKLVAMVGILPSNLAEAQAAFEAAGFELQGGTDENGVFWLAVRVEVIDGKVVVHFPQGVLEFTLTHDTVFALLSANGAAVAAE